MNSPLSASDVSQRLETKTHADWQIVGYGSNPDGAFVIKLHMRWNVMHRSDTGADVEISSGKSGSRIAVTFQPASTVLNGLTWLFLTWPGMWFAPREKRALIEFITQQTQAVRKWGAI